MGRRVRAGDRKQQKDGKKEENGQSKERMTQTSSLPFINFHPTLPFNPLFPETRGNTTVGGSNKAAEGDRLLPYKFTKKTLTSCLASQQC